MGVIDTFEAMPAEVLTELWPTNWHSLPCFPLLTNGALQVVDTPNRPAPAEKPEASPPPGRVPAYFVAVLLCC